jgi:hypothetical protein
LSRWRSSGSRRVVLGGLEIAGAALSDGDVCPEGCSSSWMITVVHFSVTATFCGIAVMKK